MPRKSENLKLLSISPWWFFCFALIIFFSFTAALSAPSDAIAIRIVSNPSHLSPSDWYKEQRFIGSPQSLLVDGYEAVRDGRTAYVNAANIVGNTLQTNIYIISYNQDVERSTIDIFGRIIKQWKFNTNIETYGKCVKPDKSFGLDCILDAECPVKEYCDSEKAKIIRDVKRLADIGSVKKSLEEFKKNSGTYPNMKSGSYLPQITLSVWPSWEKVLAQSLGISLPTDPLNKIGDCSADRFNQTTCWDENQKEFAAAVTPASGPDVLPAVSLPTGANVYLYTASPNGQKYRLCAAIETSYNNISGCFGTEIANRNPVFTSYNFPLNYATEEYHAYIEAIDPDGDALTWSFLPLNSLAIPVPTWTGWDASNMPILKSASVFKQKQLYSPEAGIPGIYNFRIIIEDGRGGNTSKDFYLTISTPRPRIDNLNCTALMRVGEIYPVCVITARHPYNSITSFEAKNLPAGMSINLINGGLVATAQISGMTTIYSAGVYNIEIIAKETGGSVSDTAKYRLTVNNYCGDGKTEKPNTEKSGGPKNDGNESCDGSDNIALSAVTSSAEKQYACASNCTYTGGYCGNNTVETPQEECDDGKNGSKNDRCDDNCVKTYCGDDIIQKPNGNEQNEDCDGFKLNNQTCQKLGYQYGTLACDSVSCAYDMTTCCNPANGVWSAWVDGVCSPRTGNYGQGTMTQTRTCTPPTCYGENCQGASSQTANCCRPAVCADLPASYTNAALSDGCGGTINCCQNNSWTPSTNTVCQGVTFTQTSNCGNTRQALGSLNPNDGNECTNDFCTNGTISHTNRPEETPCTGGNVCRSGACVLPCTWVTKYSHPSKVCSNGYQTCTTPNLPNSDNPLSVVPGATQFTGCHFGYFAYPEGSPRHVLCIIEPPPYYNNQYCPTYGIPRGTFDFAEGRIAGLHEAGLLCYPQNIPIQVCE